MHKYFDFVAHNRLVWLLCLCLLGVTFDQASKIWAQNNLSEPYEVLEETMVNGHKTEIKKQIFYPTDVVEVVPNAFNLIYKENAAAAFSLTSSIPVDLRRPLLVAVSILATCFFLIWYFLMKANDGLLLGSFSLILAGAIGNLADRMRLGYVIDFLDVHAGFLGYPYIHWPTFNVADSLIVLGAVGVIFRTFKPFK